MIEELQCPISSCRNIPLIRLNNDSSTISVFCNEHQNIKSQYEINEYLNKCNNNDALICFKCKKIISEYNFFFYCVNCSKLMDNKCYDKSECLRREHKIIKTNYMKYFDKTYCIIHNQVYTKYCKPCKISFCEKCDLRKHSNHKLIEIERKSNKEIDDIRNKLEIQEDILEKVKNMVFDYLNEIEDELKIKRLIFHNYLNNKYNGNSIENLNSIDLSINNIYKNKIEYLYKEKNSRNKFNCLFYYFKMCDKEEDKNEDEKSIGYNNKASENLININNRNKYNIKANANLNNKNNRKNDLYTDHISKKNYTYEDDYDDNAFNSPLNRYNRSSSSENEMTNNNKKILFENNKINLRNSNTNDVLDQISNPNNIINDDNRDFYNLEKGHILNSIINTFREVSKIICLTSLNSGNLALGFSNGFIKIYNCDYICIPNNNNINSNKNCLLIIEQFKGKKINYIYELKDHSLLCCTYSKIHHINLKNNDKNYDYLGSIRLSKNEISKKIIELGNDLIVSLGEKTYRKVNLSKKKSILKVFSKAYNPVKEDDDDNSEFLLSDNDNDSFKSVSSLSSSWENVYSNEEDSPFSIHDDALIEDEKIKIYKKNYNIDKIYLCSVFATKDQKIKGDNILYELIATSNNIFDEGENCVIFYGVMKNLRRHGYTFFIQKKIEGISCSKLPDSICRISSKNIAVALQYDINGIAIIDVNRKEIIRIVKGFSIGIINKPLERNIIFFITNKTKDINKSDEIRYIDELKEKLQNEDRKIICQIKTRFSGFTELRPKSIGIRNNLLFYYATSSNKELYIISIKK